MNLRVRMRSSVTNDLVIYEVLVNETSAWKREVRIGKDRQSWRDRYEAAQEQERIAAQFTEAENESQ